ncbi:MAG: hypothetical protein IJZ83_00790 [Clostridia bacterium]|nr:hypothetical protein [Clostridia bacterium]
MKKTILALLLVIALCMPMFTACGADNRTEIKNRIYSVIGLEQEMIGVGLNSDGLPVSIEYYDFGMISHVTYEPRLCDIEYDDEGKLVALKVEQFSILSIYAFLPKKQHVFEVCTWDDEGRPVETRETYAVRASFTYTDDSVTVTFRNSEVLSEYSLTFDREWRITAVDVIGCVATLTLEGNTGKFVENPDNGYANVYYEDNGALTMLEVYELNENGGYTLKETYNYTYGARGLCFRMRYTDNCSSDEDYEYYESDFEYNGDNCVKVTEYAIDNDEELLSYERFIDYNEDGKILSVRERFYADIDTFYVLTYEYDANGRCERLITKEYDENDKVISNEEIIYEYNEDGLYAKVVEIDTSYDDDGNANTTQYSNEYTYFPNGSVSEDRRIQSENGVDGAEYLYKYNRQVINDEERITTTMIYCRGTLLQKTVSYAKKGGERIKSVYFYYDEVTGEEIGMEEFFYDEYGREIKNN